jgi:hypothetical protein
MTALPKHHILRFGTEAYRIAGTIQENTDAEGRDLELHQKLFLSGVKEISRHYSFARGDAERDHGRGTQATRAAFDMLERSEAEALQAVYHSYRTVCDRLEDADEDAMFSEAAE